MNRLMKIDNKLPVKITGVFKDLPYNTYFNRLTFISSWSLYITSEPWILQGKDDWGNNSYQLFAQIADDANFSAVNKNIIKAKLNHTSAADKKYNPRIFLHPMADWHLHSNWDNNGNNTGGLIQYVWLFGTVDVFVLLLACINFMNLSTARSEKRAKEVGIRKAVGSARGQLIGQFYCESLLVVAFAFIASLIIAQLLLPWFNDVAGKEMTIPWFNPIFWLVSIALIFITGILAGSYPALYLSSFKPVKVLKGTFKTGRFAALPRKALVVVQFTISLALIIATIIIYSQIQYSKDRPIGYNRNGLMMIAMKSPDFYGKFDLLRTDLKNSGAITEIAESSSPVTDVWSDNGGFGWEGKDPSLDADFATIWVTHDFGKTVGWKFVQGRDFSREFATDTTGIVLNKAAVKFMGLKNPVGTIIRNANDAKKRAFKVIGVIDDMLMKSPYEPVRQAIYFLDYENVNWIELKLNPGKSAAESVAKIEAVFKKYIPSAPFDYKFADAEFAAKFAAEDRIGTLATFFAALAIFISCLGLFGLASFVAEQRTKEIGVRKVLGASVFNLWNLLSREFVMLVIISFTIAVPLSYYFMHNWLQNYQYRTEIYWWIFAAAGASALVITLLTVSFQAIKAAIVNPVKSLRSE
jgi:putative ABC transport system permease protein